MCQPNWFKLLQKLFVLVVFVGCLVAVSTYRNSVVKAGGDALSEIDSCDSNFDSRLDNCIGARDSNGQDTSCVSWSGNPNCVTSFGSCFTDDIHLYGQCLMDINVSMDTCENARQAASICQGNFDYCTEMATDMEQLGACFSANSECREKSGIDNCQ